MISFSVGEGNDTFAGGEGADRFVVLTNNSGRDVIQDFTVQEDILDLSFSGAASFDDLVVEVQDDQIVIRGPNGSDVALLGLNSSDLDILVEHGTVFSGRDGAGSDLETALATAYDRLAEGSLPDLAAFSDILDQGSENAYLFA